MNSATYKKATTTTASSTATPSQLVLQNANVAGNSGAQSVIAAKNLNNEKSDICSGSTSVVVASRPTPVPTILLATTSGTVSTPLGIIEHVKFSVGPDHSGSSATTALIATVAEVISTTTTTGQTASNSPPLQQESSNGSNQNQKNNHHHHHHHHHTHPHHHHPHTHPHHHHHHHRSGSTGGMNMGSQYLSDGTNSGGENSKTSSSRSFEPPMTSL